MNIRIATRKSLLALWQANHVKRLLESAYADINVELVTFTTKGDKILDTPLAKVGGKGLFVKELEEALLAKDADIAVHSMKDVPMTLPPGLECGVYLEREDPRDAFISQKARDIHRLPEGAVLGTSSLRRQSQIQALRPDIKIVSLRGNVDTRLKKLKQGDYDAIILAAAGLRRLGFSDEIASLLEPSDSIPAVGQGAIGLEYRQEDTHLIERLAPFNHPATAVCVTAERAMNQKLNGGCQVPIAGHAVLNGDTIHLKGFVGSPDGSKRLFAEAYAKAADAVTLGQRVAEDLLGQGAEALLQAVYEQHV